MLHQLILPDPGEPAYCARCGGPLARQERGGRQRPVCPACGWVYYAKTAFGAATAIDLDGGLVLVQRAYEPYAGWWMLPAGFVEYGERADETAVREAEEETGLVVALDGLLGLYFGADDPRNPAHLAVYRARAVGGTLRAADDARDVRVFRPAEVPIEAAFAGQRAALRDWLAGRGAGSAPRARQLAALDLAGPAPPVLVHAVIENPRGSTERLRLDPTSGRFAPCGVPFPWPLPAHYGYIPATRAADGAALDIVVPDGGALPAGAVLAARPVGVLYRADDDHKIVALRADGGTVHPTVHELAALPAEREALARWHAAFRPEVAITGWGDAAAARRLIAAAQAAWAASRP
jgi:8-oxo-dGTP diphosphatase